MQATSTDLTSLPAQEWHSLINAIRPRVSATVVNGKVTLTGTVRSIQEKRDLEAAIAVISGVRAIINDITVSVSSSPDFDNSILHEINGLIEGKKDSGADQGSEPYWKYFEKND